MNWTTPNRFVLAFIAMCIAAFVIGIVARLLPQYDLDYLAGFFSAAVFFNVATKP